MLKSAPHEAAKIKGRRPSTARTQRARVNRERRRQLQGKTEFTSKGVGMCIRSALASSSNTPHAPLRVATLVQDGVVDLTRLALAAITNKLCNTISTNLQYSGTRTVTPVEMDRAIHALDHAAGRRPFDTTEALVRMLYNGDTRPPYPLPLITWAG